MVICGGRLSTIATLSLGLCNLRAYLFFLRLFRFGCYTSTRYFNASAYLSFRLALAGHCLAGDTLSLNARGLTPLSLCLARYSSRLTRLLPFGCHMVKNFVALLLAFRHDKHSTQICISNTLHQKKCKLFLNSLKTSNKNLHKGRYLEPF